MRSIKVLVADDDKNICELLRLYLEKEGYNVRLAYDGEEVLGYVSDFRPDLILLDVMMPKADGWQVLKELRRESRIPVIMITAKGQTYDKVLGLELGADDYITKPFDMQELLARVKAVLRRTSDLVGEEGSVVEFDKLQINIGNYEVRIDGKVIDMPPKELELLYFLAKNPNKVFTRDQLLDKVWGFEYFGDSRTIDVHIKRLRQKLEGVSDRWELKTVWGVGYKFEASV